MTLSHTRLAESANDRNGQGHTKWRTCESPPKQGNYYAGDKALEMKLADQHDPKYIPEEGYQSDAGRGVHSHLSKVG